MTKVAIIIPTMNRPDFILRQFRFYELMNSPHPIYVSDSSNEENVDKIKKGIEKLKKLKITHKWFPPGKDYVYSLLETVEEKYCIQIGDDDLLIPDTLTECAEFLESHPDYATCAGKQVNVRFRKEDHVKPYGIIEKETLPMGRSIEDKDLFIRAKSYWSDQIFLGLTIRRTETERLIRNITKHFYFMGDLTEFTIMTTLIISGKSKSLDKLGQIMQISDLRTFDHGVTENFTSIGEDWKICEKGLSEIIQKLGVLEKECPAAVKALFIMYLYHLYVPYAFSLKRDGEPTIPKEFLKPKQVGTKKKIKNLVSQIPLVKKAYYKINPPQYVGQPESKYHKDFKVVKDFLEKNNA